ncbi:hypothetical protein DBV15_04704 [Temnothorax longispinosus]|uniref:Uncharacterized protein n=1 Tax=Temnothorax longispinosus TaxID=300112 RepID=A0A4S2K887_9HYME|nr:hypothetical protein DBV15_04704 [Temnothorax longispinosus]
MHPNTPHSCVSPVGLCPLVSPLLRGLVHFESSVERRDIASVQCSLSLS